MVTKWKTDHYKGYVIVAGRHLDTGTANFAITKPGAERRPEVVDRADCEGFFSRDEDAWAAAYVSASAYIDASLPALRR